MSAAHPADAPTLLCAGYLNIDDTAYVPALPKSDERATATAMRRGLGGMATNVACAAAALGPPWPVRAELIADLGDDAEADWALGELARRGVHAAGVRRRPGAATAHCLILVEPDGRRAIVAQPTAFDDARLAARVAEPPPSAAPRALHLDGYLVPDCLPVVAAARAQGWRCSVDFDGVPAPWLGPARLGELLDLFAAVFLNRRAARALWPELPPEAGWAAAVGERLHRLLQARPAPAAQAVVLTLGGDGLILLAPGSAPRRLAALPAAVRDSTGAGDVFAGTFLAAWLNGEAPDRAARHGAAAAALSTEGLGTLGCLPTGAAVVEAAAGAGAIFANLWD